MKTRTKISILIADDHSIIRSGLRTLLRGESSFRIAGEAANGEEALRLARQRKPDVVLLDISMPKLNGLEAARLIKKEVPLTRVLILTIYETEEYVQQMLQSGVDGYVLKNADRQELFEAIRAVAAGKRYFSKEIADLLVKGFVDRQKRAQPTRRHVPLSQRETEILGLIARGMTGPEIAAKLFLSVRTVNTHRTNIMKKLGIHETAGLVRYAIQSGLIELDP